ncbi:MAG: galactosyltransferase-related protein [Gammaproteobacteria bacterium]
MSDLKVSIICACKNRNKPLYASIGSWLLKEEVHEVIITDWSSEEQVYPMTNLDRRVKVIRVNDQKYFNQPQPLNLAASIATGDYILKFDSDYFFNPYEEYNFFDMYKIDENSFLCGIADYDSDSRTKEPIFYYLRGLMYVSRENFIKVGGYNESESKYYGNEDDELIGRLKKMGLHQKNIKQDYTIFHIPHTDKKRVENFEGFHTDKQMKNEVHTMLSQSFSGDQLKWQEEYVLAQRHIYRNKQEYDQKYVSAKIKWQLDKIEDQYYKAQKI